MGQPPRMIDDPLTMLDFGPSENRIGIYLRQNPKIPCKRLADVAATERWRSLQPRSTVAGENERAAIAVKQSGTCRAQPVGRAALISGSITRRSLLFSAVAGTAEYALPRFARAAAAILPGDAANRRFSVLYKGDRIGAHTVSYSVATGQTRITTEIDLLVKALFFTVFAFSHRSEETWRDGRLTSLKSETIEHGETLQVTGAATAQGFRVVNKAGPFIAAPGVLTSNDLWTPMVLQQTTVVDAQHGGVIGVSMRRLADEQIAVAGRQLRATRYRFITPYLAGSIWYDAGGQWVHGEFERDAAQIVYRLDT